MKRSMALTSAVAIAIAGVAGLSFASSTNAEAKHYKRAVVAKYCSPWAPYWWCPPTDPKLVGWGPPPTILAPWGVLGKDPPPKQ